MMPVVYFAFCLLTVLFVLLTQYLCSKLFHFMARCEELRRETYHLWLAATCRGDVDRWIKHMSSANAIRLARLQR